MKVGDLVKNKCFPEAGIGLVIEMLSEIVPGLSAGVPKGFPGLDAGAIALFDHGAEIIYHNEAEVINESR
jgi:hypothetical protein